MQVRPTLQRRYRESLRAVNLVVLCVVGEFSSELCRAYAFLPWKDIFRPGDQNGCVFPGVPCRGIFLRTAQTCAHEASTPFISHGTRRAKNPRGCLSRATHTHKIFLPTP